MDDRDEEATKMAAVFIGDPPPLSSVGSQELPDNPRTNTQFQIPAMPEGGGTELSKVGRAAQKKNAERLRRPLARERRPTLLPGNLPPKLPSASHTVEPGLVAPVRPKADSSRPNLTGRDRESSDVIQTFDSTGGDEGDSIFQTEQTPPRSLPKPRIRSRLQRKIPRPPPRSGPQRTAPPGLGAGPSARLASPPPVLPLNPEVLSVHIADQRRRLRIVDGFSRALEITAGILGTLGFACLIAAVVSIFVGSDVSVLAASAAIVGGLGTLALTFLMVVAAVALRQLAHSSAQIAALLEALTGYRG